MVATVELERRVAGAYILGVVVGELSHQEEPSPIIFLVIDESSQVGLHCTVLPLDLAINLGVESSREPSLDSQKVA